jgi:hypothetical protein
MAMGPKQTTDAGSGAVGIKVRTGAIRSGMGTARPSPRGQGLAAAAPIASQEHGWPASGKGRFCLYGGM